MTTIKKHPYTKRYKGDFLSRIEAYPFIKMYVKTFLKKGTIEELREEMSTYISLRRMPPCHKCGSSEIALESYIEKQGNDPLHYVFCCECGASTHYHSNKGFVLENWEKGILE